MNYPAGNPNNRINDDEVLYTTLLLIQGEPPTAPHPKDNAETHVFYSHEFRQYAARVKGTMRDLGHNAEQGQFTCFIHWHKELWNAKKHEQYAQEPGDEEGKASST